MVGCAIINRVLSCNIPWLLAKQKEKLSTAQLSKTHARDNVFSIFFSMDFLVVKYWVFDSGVVQRNFCTLQHRNIECHSKGDVYSGRASDSKIVWTTEKGKEKDEGNNLTISYWTVFNFDCIIVLQQTQSRERNVQYGMWGIRHKWRPLVP